MLVYLVLVLALSTLGSTLMLLVKSRRLTETTRIIESQYQSMERLRKQRDEDADEIMELEGRLDVLENLYGKSIEAISHHSQNAAFLESGLLEVGERLECLDPDFTLESVLGPAATIH